MAADCAESVTADPRAVDLASDPVGWCSTGTWATFSVEEWVGLVSGETVPELNLRNMRDHGLADTAAGQALVGAPDIENLRGAFKQRGYHVHIDWAPVQGRRAS
eukprot:8204592-Pyramimonas_sp.AAC.1